MRRAAKVDANQAELVKTLRKLGISVAITSSAHDGFPDLVLGYGGVTVLAEVKDGNRPPSERKLTPRQVEFHGEFAGAITIIETVEQAIKLAHRLRVVAALHNNVDWGMGAAANG